MIALTRGGGQEALDFGNPPGNSRCIWMLAGIVDYKLCDRDFDCEHCPFDEAIQARPGAVHRADPVREEEQPGHYCVEGYRAPHDLFFDPRHVWARVGAGGSVLVGMDDFAQSLIGRARRVELPHPGTEVDRRHAAWNVSGQWGDVSLPVPVEGVVFRANLSLEGDPLRLNRDPYGEGSAFVIEPRHLVRDLKELFYGFPVREWYSREITRLRRSVRQLLELAAPVAGTTLADGGEIARLLDVIHAENLAGALVDLFLSADRGDPADDAGPGVFSQ